jgi:predicted enzyme related to lactoylglutathione lyase
MAKRDKSPIGAPCWVDLLTSDTDKSRAFYCELFGWVAEAPAEEFGGYFMFSKDGVPVAGCMANQPGSFMPERWSVHLATDDARKTVDAAVAAGGQALVAPMDVGDIGTMSFVADPGGAGVGAWQPKQFQGFGVVAEAGTPSWFELLTGDYQACVNFYREVFGWDTEVASDTPDP